MSGCGCRLTGQRVEVRGRCGLQGSEPPHALCSRLSRGRIDGHIAQPVNDDEEHARRQDGHQLVRLSATSLRESDRPTPIHVAGAADSVFSKY